MLSPIRSQCFVTRPAVRPEPLAAPTSQPAAPGEDWLLTLAKYTPGPTLAIPAGLAFWTRVAPHVAAQVGRDAQAVGQGLADTARDAWQGLTNLWTGLFGPAPSPQQLPPNSPPPMAQEAAVDPLAHAREARQVRRMFREVFGRDASDAEIADGQRLRAEGMSRTELRQHWAATPEARIGRIFEAETGQPINAMGRGYWLNEHQNGASYGEIRTRLREHMAYLKEKGYAG